MWKRQLSADEIIYFKHATIPIQDTFDLQIEAYFPLNQAVCTPEVAAEGLGCRVREVACLTVNPKL